MKILLLDSINKNTLAIARHLGITGKYNLHVAYHNSFSITNHSKYIFKKHRLPNPKDKSSFHNKLTELLRSQKFDLVIPVGFSSYTACADIQEEIRKYSDIIITSAQNIDIAASKAQTYQLAERIGVPCPKTIYLQNRNQVNDLELQYPVVLKGPFEAGKNIVTYVYNKQSLISEYHTMIEKNNFSEPHLPLIQEFIEGDGYGFFAYYERGTCKRIFMHQRIREYPAKGGASVCAQSFFDEQLMQYGKKILDHLKWNGVAMVEFKKDKKDNLYKLMEINPKFWGSLDLALCADVNFPQYLIDQHNKQEVTYSEKFKNVRFQWLLNGELFHFFQRPASFFRILKDMGRSENDFWLRDFKPNIFQLFYILAFYFKKWKG